jgi:hypothetical protein
MAIRPLRTRTTKEDVKNIGEAMRKAGRLSRQSTTNRLSRYIIVFLLGFGGTAFIVKQIFNKFLTKSSEDE